MSSARRLGIYVDDLYTLSPCGGTERVSTDRAFMLFAAEVAHQLDRELLVFGRARRAEQPAEHELPQGTGIVALPTYVDLTHLGEVARAAPGTARAMWRGLDGVDTVWVFGPHPFGLLLAGLGVLRRRRIVLGVRQDTLGYYRSRLRSVRWTPALALTWLLDHAYRLLARRVPVTVVGRELARGYGRARPTVLAMTVTLIQAADVVAAPVRHDWNGSLELLTVGRLDAEKNPFILIDALELLEQRLPGRYHLTWVGRGPLEDEFAARAAAAGLGDRVRLAGYVPFGPELLDLYRSAHLFVHVSRTEGVPQVLVEAFASGVPVVATDVGGVAGAVEHGAAALLVPPAQVEPLVEAIVRLSEDGAERGRLAARGLELARTLTREAEAARVARFVAGSSAAAHALDRATDV